MTRPKSPLRVPNLAAALLLSATAALAGPQRAGDAGVSAGPVVAPTVNAGPVISPNLGSGVGAVAVPGAGVNTGVAVPGGALGPSASVQGPSASAAAPSAGAASVGAPSAADLSRQAARLGPSAS